MTNGTCLFVYWHCLFHENKMKHWLNGIKTVLQKSKYRSLIKCFKKWSNSDWKKSWGKSFFCNFCSLQCSPVVQKKSVNCISMPDLVNDPSVMVKSLNCSLFLCFNLLISDRNNAILNDNAMCRKYPPGFCARRSTSSSASITNSHTSLYCFGGHVLAQLKHWWSWLTFHPQYHSFCAKFHI